MSVQKTPRHGLRRALVRLLKGVAAFLLVVVVVNGAFYGYYSWQVGKRVAALRRAGEPVYLEEVRWPEVKEEENAWGDYVRLFHLREDGSSTDLRRVGELTERQYEALTGYEKSDAELRKLMHEPGVRKTVAALRAASLKPRMVRPLDKVEEGRVFMQWSSFRNAVRVCRNLAVAAALDGDMGQAGELLLTALRISGQVADEPTVMAQLVAAAMYGMTVASGQESLAVGRLPERQSEDLQKELKRRQGEVAPMTQHAYAIKRAEEVSAYRDLEWRPLYAIQWVSYLLAPREDGTPDYGIWLSQCIMASSPAYWKRQQMIAIDLLARQIELTPVAAQHLQELNVLRETWRRRFVDVAQHNAIFATLAMRTLVHRLWMNQFSVALALNDYCREHGRYPESLAELPQPLPGDVLSGEAFRYRRVGEKYLLYAIGADRRDDGGKGLKPRQADDVGDWVWRVERRR